jgi:hypothetical protein
LPLPAQGSGVPSFDGIHDLTDCLDDNRWLAEGDTVSRSLSDDLASIRRQPDLITLQVEPRRIAAQSGRDDDPGMLS